VKTDILKSILSSCIFKGVVMKIDKRFLDNLFPIVGVSLLVVTVISLGVLELGKGHDPLHKNKLDNDYRIAISPVHLKEKNNADRRAWVSDCLGRVGGGTTLAECTLSAKELYPEQDWVELAKSNMATMVQPKLN
jgi:hypothetical protein